MSVLYELLVSEIGAPLATQLVTGDQNTVYTAENTDKYTYSELV